MYRTRVAIIGAGQAGLAVSYLLTASGVEHVLLERGRIAERWLSQRWDSLHTLTPNWMSRLPGWAYQGPDPDGYLPAKAVAGYLADYAASFDAPVVYGADVRSVRQDPGAAGARSGRGGYRVVTDAGTWLAQAVVVATGNCDQAAVPAVAAQIDSSITQLTPDRYRNPGDVPPGGVLVVGASATGAQLSDELSAAGHDVLLSVGRHTRLPRRYRGLDIMWWLDSIGLLNRPVDRQRAFRPEPSLQLVGSHDHREIDLPTLRDRGITLAGRLSGVASGVATFADDLGVTSAEADAKLDRLLNRIDRFATEQGLNAQVETPHRLRSAVPRGLVPTQVDLRRHGIRSVLWATGYRRTYPWLEVPVLDSRGEIRHTAGRTAAPGLVVIGMGWQTRRNSATLDGVRHDATLVVDHLLADVLGGELAGLELAS